MGAITESLLPFLSSYGYTAVVVVVFVAAVGLPLPAGVVLLVAGALAGEGRLELPALAPLALAAAVLGDLVGYGVGNTGGYAVIERHGSRVGLSAELMQSSRGHFARFGGAAVLLTRFLLTPLAAPINLLAGGAAYPLPRFLLCCALGEGAWVAGYLGLGRVLGVTWEEAIQKVARWSRAPVYPCLALVLLYGAYRLYRRRPPTIGDAPRVGCRG